MTAWERVRYWGLVAVLALGVVFCAMLARSDAADPLERCIGATCKIVGEDGSTGTGVAYCYGVRQGRRYVVIATAAHVIKGSAKVTVYFGRKAVKAVGSIIVRNPKTDGGCVIVPIEQFNGSPPPAVKLGGADLVVPQGQAIFSVGCPGGGPLMLWTGYAKGYAQDNSLLFWPGPELGRSGSPIFAMDASGEPMVVGIISARYSQNLTPETVGKAVSTQLLLAPDRYTRETAFRAWETQCGPNGCPTPAPGGDNKRYIMPYRGKTDERLDRVEHNMAEKSQGTLPLPPVAPPVDLGPVDKRLSEVEKKVDLLDLGLGKTAGEVEQIKATYKAIEGKFPDLDKAVKEVFGKADAAAVGANAVAQKAEDAAKQAADAKKTVDEAVDEDNPKGLVAKLKARLESKGMDPTMAAVLSGLGVGGGVLLLVGLGLMLVKRDVRQYVQSGGEDKLAIQKLAGATPWGFDDAIADRIASRMEARYVRRHPDAAPPPQPVA